MLKRVLIDNFRCFSSFEFRPGKECLIIGANGSGKTSFIDVMSIVRELVVVGGRIDNSLPARSRSVWRSDRKQTLELEVEIRGEVFRYTLVVDRSTEESNARVASERVYCDGIPIFLFEEGNLHLISDSGETLVQFPSDVHRSGLSTIQARADNAKLMTFKSWFSSLHCLRPDPRAFRNSLAPGESLMPGDEFQWFLSWYRNMVQERPGENAALTSSLIEVLPGLETIRWEAFGPRSKVLIFGFKHESSGGNYRLEFHELSDGQRMLVLLYAVLHFLLVEGRTIILDEPDNYVALREIQPWLLAMERQLPDSGQILLISHHPELLSNFSRQDIFRFRRVSDGLIRAEAIPGPDPAGLSLYEEIARGWLDER